MAGTAPTDFRFTGTLDAGPVHCSDWLCSTPSPPDRQTNRPAYATNERELSIG
jgi:hypothetical protein